MTIELRLIQGDCLKVMKDLPDESVDLVVTDPPYPNFDLFDTNHGCSDDFYKKVFDELFRVLKNNKFFITYWSISDLPHLFELIKKTKFKFIWIFINFIKNAQGNHIRIGFSMYNLAVIFQTGRGVLLH